MNLQHLKNMTEVERAGSVTKAAANLFICQPNLSKSIKEVENEIGITVFRRSAKGVYPTPEGARFLARARAVLEEMDKLEALYKQGNTAHFLSVCVPEGEYAAAAAAEFASLFPCDERTELECITASLSRAALCVSEGKCAIAAVRCPRSEEEYFRKLQSEMQLSAEKLRTGKFMLIFSEKSPLCSMNNITPEALDGLIRVCTDSSSRAGGRINVQWGDSLELLSKLPQGYMISPDISSAALKKFGLVGAEYSEAQNYTEYLIYPAGYKPDEYTDAFIGCLKKAIIERRI